LGTRLSIAIATVGLACNRTTVTTTPATSGDSIAATVDAGVSPAEAGSVDGRKLGTSPLPSEARERCSVCPHACCRNATGFFCGQPPCRLAPWADVPVVRCLCYEQDGTTFGPRDRCAPNLTCGADHCFDLDFVCINGRLITDAGAR
jgi:hypothetical protein